MPRYVGYNKDGQRMCDGIDGLCESVATHRVQWHGWSYLCFSCAEDRFTTAVEWHIGDKAEFNLEDARLGIERMRT